MMHWKRKILFCGADMIDRLLSIAWRFYGCRVLFNIIERSLEKFVIELIMNEISNWIKNRTRPHLHYRIHANFS